MEGRYNNLSSFYVNWFCTNIFDFTVTYLHECYRSTHSALDLVFAVLCKDTTRTRTLLGLGRYSDSDSTKGTKESELHIMA